MSTEQAGNQPILTWESAPDILTPHHLAQLLHCSYEHACALGRLSPEKGGIPSFKVGRLRRFRKDAVIAWTKRIEENPFHLPWNEKRKEAIS